ncbi:MAG: flagellar biosynthesis protein FlgJ [Alkaliphilus sp.]|nr:rod-binding protein [bacterium AH-315-L21]MBN4062566.1 rod-binding protein [Alkaliphilus sp. AH-315-G20]MBN4074567.1 rod-binding protein [bacterium AH-315-E09]PHS35380.1 MAG: flagellar biosynthesis protein FlgJ [Alkaliphilus sp.]
MKINNPHSLIKNEMKMQKKADIENSENLLEACKQFEAIFLNMMLQQMRKSVWSGGLTEKSQGREIFESMKDEKMTEDMALDGGIGLAKQLYQQLSNR